jgi:amino acid transporter
MSPILKPAQRKMRLVPLIAATYFMVSGGPYGIEDILGGAGYGWAIAILLVLPFVWSLPTALMIGELASAIPADGGFYIWVRRALGPFWGYQESWLSLSASIFDMAIWASFHPPSPPAGRPMPGPWRLSRYAAYGTCAAHRR